MESLKKKAKVAKLPQLAGGVRPTQPGSLGCVSLEAHPHVGFTGSYPRDTVAASGQDVDIVREASALTRP